MPGAAGPALAVAAPLALAALLVPWRADVPGTDAALALLLVVVAVAARGRRLAGIELLAEAGGLLRGRFLLTPQVGARPSLEQRQLAAALADQAGVALAGQRPAGRRP